jgi:hypothetical protein
MLVGMPEGKKPLGRSKHRLVENIKMDLGNRMRWYGLDLSGSGQGEVEGACEQDNEPSGFIKY